MKFIFAKWSIVILVIILFVVIVIFNIRKKIAIENYHPLIINQNHLHDPNMNYYRSVFNHKYNLRRRKRRRRRL